MNRRLGGRFGEEGNLSVLPELEAIFVRRPVPVTLAELNLRSGPTSHPDCLLRWVRTVSWTSASRVYFSPWCTQVLCTHLQRNWCPEHASHASLIVLWRTGIGDKCCCGSGSTGFDYWRLDYALCVWKYRLWLLASRLCLVRLEVPALITGV